MPVARSLVVGSLTLVTAFAGLAVSAAPASAAPATRYVATTGSDTANDCLSKATPCATVQHAVGEAAAGDTVQIAKGTYNESVSLAVAITLQGDPTGGTVIRATNNQPSVSAGGPDAQGEATTLRDLDISGNTSAPGVIGLGVRLSIIDSHVDRNAGGVLGLLSLVTLDGSTTSRNTGVEQGGFLSSGFGLLVFGGVVAVTNSSADDNAAGGIAVSTDFGLNRRVAAAPPADDVDSTIVDSTVSGNGQFGVGSDSGSLDIDSSTVSGNDSIGVYAIDSAVTVRNSTIADTGNKALTGPGAPTSPAGVYYQTRTGAAGDRVVARAAGVTGRTAEVAFGKRTVTLRATAPRRVAAAPVGITLSATALDQSGSVKDCVAARDGGYNSSADASNSCGFSAAKNDLVRTAAKLGPLADNGGPTRTRLPALTSPLLNAIPAGKADCTSGATDQRGVSRPQNERCDIGAVERELAPVRITTKSLPDGQVGETYRKALGATGGDGDYAWSLAKGSSLPDGLKLSAAGVISGTPAEAGTFSVTVVADGATKRFTLTIDAAGAAPADDSQDPIAETGAASASLMAWGSALLLAGFAVMVLAGHVGRRPGRHRPTT